MKIYNKIFLLAVLGVLSITSACKKEVSLTVEMTPCEAEQVQHPNHETYQGILDSYAKKGIVGMTAVISKPNEETWSGSAGYASIEDQIKMNPCHLHHTASLVKSFVAVMTLQLIEEDKLSFDTKVAPFLSEEIKSYTPNVEELTIKHLLQQTSGIPDIFDVEFFTKLMNDPERIYTTEELLKFNERKDSLQAVGEKHVYADPNFMLLALIIDEIEGNHITSLKDRIIEPLNVSGLHYHDANFPNIDGVAASYWEQYDDGKIENISDIQNRLVEYILGSDGIIASPKDMTQFYKSVFENELLENETMQILKTDWVAETEENRMNTKYSHGFMVVEKDGENWIGHAGLQIGASCFVFYNLETGVTIGLFTNTGTFLSQEKKELVYGELWDELTEAVE